MTKVIHAVGKVSPPGAHVKRSFALMEALALAPQLTQVPMNFAYMRVVTRAALQSTSRLPSGEWDDVPRPLAAAIANRLGHPLTRGPSTTTALACLLAIRPQDPNYDVLKCVTNNVRWLDNERNLDSAILPIPDMGGTNIDDILNGGTTPTQYPRVPWIEE